jgi:transcription elongation factor GreA
MRDEKVMLTREGLEKLQNELKYLKEVERPEVAQKIREALAFGDLSENAEYAAAKDRQAFVEGRILSIERMLENYELIEENKRKDGVISVGSHVKIQDVKSGITLEFAIVGSPETDPLSGKISRNSPLGKALLGKKEGEVVDVKVPAGLVKYKILKVE